MVRLRRRSTTSSGHGLVGVSAVASQKLEGMPCMKVPNAKKGLFNMGI